MFKGCLNVCPLWCASLWSVQSLHILSLIPLPPPLIFQQYSIHILISSTFTSYGMRYYSKQASGLALPADLVPLCLQQLLWLQKAHTPMQVAHTPGTLLPCGHQTIQSHQLCCPTGTINLLLSARSVLPHTPVSIRLQALLFYSARRPSLPLFLTSREPSLPHQRARMPDTPRRGGKL
jgi:hypothetical protein